MIKLSGRHTPLDLIRGPYRRLFGSWRFSKFLMLLLGVIAATSFSLILLYSWTGASVEWYNNDWGFRRLVTVDNTKVPGGSNLVDFPMLVRLDSSAELSARAQSGGEDILFTADNGTTKLSHEIQSFDSSTGELIAWVRVPTLSYNEDTQIYLYYGNPSASDQQDVASVWDSNYVGAWHMNNDPSSSNVLDSTINNNDGVPNGAMTSADLVPGKIGDSLEFDGSDDVVRVTDSPSTSIEGDQFTLSAWVYPTDLGCGTSTCDHGFISKAHESGSNVERYHLGVNRDGAINARRYSGALVNINGSAGDIVNGEWQFVSAIYDGTTLKAYVNGIEVASGSASGNIDASADDLLFGKRYNARFFAGGLDTIRISNIGRSVEWVQAEFNNQDSPSEFYSISQEETNYTLQQVVYRWYANSSSLTPGPSKGDFSQTVALRDVASIRLRMGVQALSQAISANVQSFRLQYSTSLEGGWSDVDQPVLTEPFIVQTTTDWRDGEGSHTVSAFEYPVPEGDWVFTFIMARSGTAIPITQDGWTHVVSGGPVSGASCSCDYVWAVFKTEGDGVRSNFSLNGPGTFNQRLRLTYHLTNVTGNVVASDSASGQASSVGGGVITLDSPTVVAGANNLMLTTIGHMGIGSEHGMYVPSSGPNLFVEGGGATSGLTAFGGEYLKESAGSYYAKANWKRDSPFYTDYGLTLLSLETNPNMYRPDYTSTPIVESYSTTSGDTEGADGSMLLDAPPGIEEGDLLVYHLSRRDEVTIAPEGFTNELDLSRFDTGGAHGLRIAWKIADTSDVNATTYEFSAHDGETQRQGVAMLRISNYDPENPVSGIDWNQTRITPSTSIMEEESLSLHFVQQVNVSLSIDSPADALYVQPHVGGGTGNPSLASVKHTAKKPLSGAVSATGGDDQFVVSATLVLNPAPPLWSFTNSVDYNIGDIGPAGGRIFYIDSDVYYEAAPEDWQGSSDPFIQWGCRGQTVSGAGGLAFGDGVSNSAAIVSHHDDTANFSGEDYYTFGGDYATIGCTADNNGDVAAKTVDSLSVNGYSDWFIPSRDELAAIRTNLYLEDVGGLSDSWYASSSQHTDERGWVHRFDTDEQSSQGPKDVAHRVRPVRSFVQEYVAPDDGLTLLDNLLYGATARGSYNKSNPTVFNPNGVAADGILELDFDLWHQGEPGKTYYFRLIDGVTGRPVDEYLRYPQITVSEPIITEEKTRHGGSFVDGVRQPYQLE